ncbi:AAA family ATPase [Rhizobium sp. BG4]|nr:AAA family ATPase [Rhizobium sp. BG4]
MDGRPNITTEFRLMRIIYPEMVAAHSAFDNVREARRSALEIGGRSKIEGSLVSLFGKSHAGKTTILEAYMEAHFPDDVDPEKPDNKRPQRKIVGITLNGDSSYLSFVKQILRAYKDPFPGDGNADDKLERIIKYINYYKTELLIFDEASNLRIRKATDLDATKTHNTLRGFAKMGCPVVVAGTEEAESKILSDGQLVSMNHDVSIKTLKQDCAADMHLFGSYCADLGLALKEHGLFPKRSNFVIDNTIACLFIASGGLRGRVSRLVEHAAYIARHEDAEEVRLDHLEAATDAYSIKNKIVTHNPFRESRKTRKKETRVA